MDKTKTIELTNDYIFKRVFSKKGNEDILKDLLESILEIKIDKIETMEEVELPNENIENRIGVLDLKATVNENTTIDIEIQVKDYHNMIERSTFYVAGLYHTGLKRGEEFETNNKVIGINILKFNIFEWKKYHSKGILKEEKLNEVITEALELHFIEIPKFLKSKNEGSKKLRQWLEFISNERKGEIEMAVKENEKIAKAKEEYEYLTGDAAVQRLAFLRDKWERDHKSEIAWERKEAKKEGIRLGEIESKKQIAKEMIKKKMEDEIILELTKISKEELETIKKELKN